MLSQMCYNEVAKTNTNGAFCFQPLAGQQLHIIRYGQSVPYVSDIPRPAVRLGDDQQTHRGRFVMTMTWEWIGGFFEGEGCISWYEGENGTKHGLGGRITIGQKDKRPLQAIYDFLLDQGFPPPGFYLRPYPKKSKYNRSPLWIIAIQKREDVIRFLTEIEPFLFEKREKAQYVISRLTNLIEEREAILARATELRKSGLTWREISLETGVGRTALMNYFKAEGIDLKYGKRDTKIPWKKWRAEKGLCCNCGEPRGQGGTKYKCRKCADRYNEYSKKRRQAIIESGLCRDCQNPRGDNGTTMYCRSCADNFNETKRNRSKGSPPIDYEVVLIQARASD